MIGTAEDGRAVHRHTAGGKENVSVQKKKEKEQFIYERDIRQYEPVPERGGAARNQGEKERTLQYRSGLLCQKRVGYLIETE